MKKDASLVILKAITIFIASILIFLIAFFQYTGVGVLFKANSENKIEDFVFTDITQNKEINPNGIIENNSGIRVQLDDSTATINVVEIEAEETTNRKIMARMYYTFEEIFSTSNSVVLELREGKNYVSLNKNNLTELYFDLPKDSIKINSIIINPHYSIAKVIGNWVPIILINFLVLLFCFFLLDSNVIFPKDKSFVGDDVLRIAMLFYYNKFFIIMGESARNRCEGFVFLLILLLLCVFLKMISKENIGGKNES